MWHGRDGCTVGSPAGGGSLDQVGDGVGSRFVDGVAARHLDDGRAGALGHRPPRRAAGRSPANDAEKSARSRNKYPSLDGRIGGAGTPGGGSAGRDPTDSPLTGANAAT